LAQVALGQDPIEWIKAQRAEKKTWDDISYELRGKMPNRRPISRETVRAWAEAQQAAPETP